jgi:hypothetical protein
VVAAAAASSGFLIRPIGPSVRILFGTSGVLFLLPFGSVQYVGLAVFLVALAVVRTPVSRVSSSS